MSANQIECAAPKEPEPQRTWKESVIECALGLGFAASAWIAFQMVSWLMNKTFVFIK